MGQIDPTQGTNGLTTRRGFLQVGYSGLLGMGLPSLLAARAAGASAMPSTATATVSGVGRAKSVIVILLSGGLGQHDSFDMKPEAPDAWQRHGPRKEESDFQVEDDEEDRNQVVTHVELDARVLECVETALVRRQLLRVTTIPGRQPAQDAAEAQQNSRQRRGDNKKNQNRQVVREHCAPVC